MGKSKKSKKPSGLKITRSGMKFICEWKIPSGGYDDGQQFKSTPGGSANVGKKDTKKTISISASDYYPNLNAQGKHKKKLTAFSFKVRSHAVKNVHVLFFDVYVLEEIFPHKIVIALVMFRL